MSIQDIIEGKKEWRAHVARVKALPQDYQIVYKEIQKYLRGELADVHTEAIEQTAKEQGMVTMLQMGVLKALEGETTLEEVNRVL